MQVLVADDDSLIRELMAVALKGAGHEVVAVDDGAKALEELRRGHCQMLITDWQMPNMSGPELCRAVRMGDLGRYVYVIMVTGVDHPQAVVDGLSTGADDFISKPFNIEELLVRIRAGERLLAMGSAEMTIFVMACLAESRDSETGAHLERVRSYSRVLAEHLRKLEKFRGVIDEEYVQLIYQTSPLHDIGKVATPDAVLRKPGKLTPQEYEVMKEHTLHAARTLERAMKKYPNAKFLAMAREIALTHHEKYDGSGYPAGLAGEKIPLCGRIVAVADVYDALTSRRVYKEAFTHEMSRVIIIKGNGGHFDPDVVEAFVACEPQFIEIHRNFADEKPISAL